MTKRVTALLLLFLCKVLDELQHHLVGGKRELKNRKVLNIEEISNPFKIIKAVASSAVRASVTPHLFSSTPRSLSRRLQGLIIKEVDVWSSLTQ